MRNGEFCIITVLCKFYDLSIQCQRDNKRRTEKLQKMKLESVKQARVKQKCKRSEEQQKRYYIMIYCHPMTLILLTGKNG